MNKIIFVGITTMMLVACSGNKAKSDNSEVASDSVSTIENGTQTNAAKIFILTEDGVGSLKIKQSFKDMSQSDEGLYNKIEKTSFDDESSGTSLTEYKLYWDEEMVASFTVSNAKDPIVMLHVHSPRVSMPNGVKVGTPLREVLKQEGLRAIVEEDVMGESPFGYSAWIAMGKICVYGWWSYEDILTSQGKTKAAAVRSPNVVKLLPEDIKSEAKVTDLCIYRKDE